MLKKNEFCKKLDGEDEKGQVFRLARQMVRQNRDVVGCVSVNDCAGKVVAEEENVLDTC